MAAQDHELANALNSLIECLLYLRYIGMVRLRYFLRQPLKREKSTVDSIAAAGLMPRQ